MIVLQTDIPQAVGGGYGEFWYFRGRYRVVKGSRGCKKSKTAALWFIIHLMLYPKANLLVVRKVYRTLKGSCFADLRWAVRRLGVEDKWQFRVSPSLEVTYAETGQTIYFRGLDNPMKINSIAAPVGQLCWLWIEEAFEISREADFDMLDEAIRGRSESGMFKQITLTFNPWDERHWLKGRFFDPPPTEDVLAMTVNYQVNEFLDERDLTLFTQMKERNPRRYQVAGLGEWGVHEGLIYENWRQERFSLEEVKKKPGISPIFGLDFGFTNDPTALFCGLVDTEAQAIYVFDELYERGLTNTKLAQILKERAYAREVIRADSAEPKSIEELRRQGITKIRGVKKGADSVRHGILKLQDYELIVHPKCKHFLAEITSYTWARDKRSDTTTNRPDARAEDHLMDAMRYAMEDLGQGVRFSF